MPNEKATIRIYLSEYIASWVKSTYGVSGPGGVGTVIRFPECSRFFQILKETILPPDDIMQFLTKTRLHTTARREAAETVNNLPLFRTQVAFPFEDTDAGYIDVEIPERVRRYDHMLITSATWRLPKSATEVFKNELRELFWAEMFAQIGDMERNARINRLPPRTDLAIDAFLVRYNIRTDLKETIMRTYYRRVKGLWLPANKTDNRSKMVVK